MRCNVAHTSFSVYRLPLPALNTIPDTPGAYSAFTTRSATSST